MKNNQQSSTNQCSIKPIVKRERFHEKNYIKTRKSLDTVCEVIINDEIILSSNFFLSRLDAMMMMMIFGSCFTLMNVIIKAVWELRCVHYCVDFSCKKTFNIFDFSSYSFRTRHTMDDDMKCFQCFFKLTDKTLYSYNLLAAQWRPK